MRPVIPIVRAPDDPDIDDEPPSNEFAEPAEPAQRQAGGWRLPVPLGRVNTKGTQSGAYKIYGND